MMFKKKTFSGGPEYLIVGLGNPGRQYENTRHNAGWLCMDMLSDKLGVKINKIKYKSTVCEADVGGTRCLLMKPQTFMNLSGEAVGEACRFYKIPPEKVIVIFDDISLEPGKIRLRRKGSHGGHNGIKSITEHLSSSDFPRIKIGVGGAVHDGYDLKDWVLSRFSKEDEKLLFDAFGRVNDALFEMIKEGIDVAMCHYN